MQLHNVINQDLLINECTRKKRLKSPNRGVFFREIYIEELTFLIFHYLSRRMKEENPDLVTLAFVMGTSLKGNETIGI